MNVTEGTNVQVIEDDENEKLPRVCKTIGCGCFLSGAYSVYNDTRFVQVVLGDDWLAFNSTINIAESIVVDGDIVRRENVLDLIYEWLLLQSLVNESYDYFFIYNEAEETDAERLDAHRMIINIAKKLSGYPKTIVEVVNRSLVNLSCLFPQYGKWFGIKPSHHRLFFSQGRDREDIGFLLMLKDFNYLEIENNKYRITAEGWKQIEKIKRDSENSTDVFIAMSFGEETKEIRESFKSAIKECGYIPVIIDEVHHNNQIVPEILYHIKKSKFVVVDVTDPNYGAYYEAGYAQALNKEVIICCQQEAFDSPDRKKRPHFDISQKSMVVWDTHEELVERLIKRIEATVGRR